MGNNFIDLTGVRFVKLLVVERADNDAKQRARWRCVCDCGAETVSSSAALRDGRSKSCGCIRKDTLKRLGAPINRGHPKKALITKAAVLARFEYDKSSGIFRYLARDARPGKQAAPDETFNKRFAGKIAGHLHSDGYVIITIGKTRVYGHHLVWLVETGSWPSAIIDHKNGNPADNRFDNLRECTHSQNGMNSKIWSHNTSGVKGVSFRENTGQYYAYIKRENRMRSLGLYATLDEAKAAREAAEKQLFGDFRRKQE